MILKLKGNVEVIKRIYSSIVILLSLYLLSGCNSDTNIKFTETPVPPEHPITQLSFNIQASRVSGDLLLNSKAFSDSVYDSAVLSLRTDNESVVLGSSTEQSYDVMLVNGSYTPYYTHFSGDEVPANLNQAVSNEQDIIVDQALNIDVPMITISPLFSLDGTDFPNTIDDSGRFYLQSVATKELIFLGESYTQNEEVNIIPGNYHVVYSYRQGSNVPKNKSARIISNVSLQSSQRLLINVNSMIQSVEFSHNGVAFPDSAYEQAGFYLINPEVDDEVLLGFSKDQSSRVKIVPGSYNIHYRYIDGQSIPLNKDKVLQKNIEISSGTPLNINVESIHLSGTFTLNNKPFPDSVYESAEVKLFDPETQSEVLLGKTHQGYDNLMVIPGGYNLIYNHTDGSKIPLNSDMTFTENLLFDSSTTYEIDVPAITLTAKITLDGDVFPTSIYEHADVYLKEVNSTKDILLTSTYNQGGDITVIAGNYNMFYRHKEGDTIPRNSYFRLFENKLLNQSQTINYNIQSARVQASASLNSTKFSSSVYQSAKIYLSANDGDNLLLLSTSQASEPLYLIAGIYDVFYQHFNGDLVPQNKKALIEQQKVIEAN